MKVKSTRWIGGCGLGVAVLAVSLLRTADGQQGIPAAGRNRVFNNVRVSPPADAVPEGSPSSGQSFAEFSRQVGSPGGTESAGARSGSLIAFSSMLASGQQQVVVLDSAQYVLSVYRISPDSGEISLVSVRNIRLDSAIDNYNSGNPSPEDIRKMVPK